MMPRTQDAMFVSYEAPRDTLRLIIISHTLKAVTEPYQRTEDVDLFDTRQLSSSAARKKQH